MERIFLQPISIVTIIIIKPDAYHKVNKLLRQIIQQSFRIVGLKLSTIPTATAAQLVASDLAAKQEHVSFTYNLIIRAF